jgi:hypothetical protein
MDLAQRITQGWIARADRLEDYWRDYAFLGLTETLRIAGANRPQGGGYKIELRQLTLRMFIQLCAVRSPFLVGGRVGPEHVAQILWRLSPEYGRQNETAKVGNGETADAPILPFSDSPVHSSPRQRFVASIADLPFTATTRAITRFLDRMLIDKPPSSTKANGSRPDTSFAASVIHQLGKEYGWNDETILDLPMPRLFQYMRKIHRGYDPDLSYFNPLRDRFKTIITGKVIAQRKARREDVIGTDGCKASTETTPPSIQNPKSKI